VGAFVRAEIEGCPYSWCSPLPDGREICACQDPNEAETRFFLRSGGAIVKRWSQQNQIMGGASPSTMRIESIGVDAGMTERVLIAVEVQCSMGMAVDTWAVWLLDGMDLRGPIDVSEFGTLSFQVCSPEGKRSYLLGGDWQWDSEPGRGEGLYFKARWYDLDGPSAGWLEPSAERPLVERRYLFGFEKQRNAAKNRGQSVLWYRTADTRPLATQTTGR
jgi:hypothetical protein